jgi:UDP-2,4-diacetamido-2,4,6-trideoxy-beta-L-altropyranose hydrolase
MIKLRRATRKDCRLIWQWANDPEVRAESFAPEPILYEDHVNWYETKLNDAGCCIYIADDIAENSDIEPVGQIRFDLKAQEAVISISLDRKFRGQGRGARIIELASKTFLAASDAKKIHAYVKKDNTVSLAAFKKAGFSSVKSVLVDNQAAHHLILAGKE